MKLTKGSLLLQTLIVMICLLVAFGGTSFASAVTPTAAQVAATKKAEEAKAAAEAAAKKAAAEEAAKKAAAEEAAKKAAAEAAAKKAAAEAAKKAAAEAAAKKAAAEAAAKKAAAEAAAKKAKAPAKPTVPTTAALNVPKDVNVKIVDDKQYLTWSPVAGAVYYNVYINGKLTGKKVKANEYLLNTAAWKKDRLYRAGVTSFVKNKESKRSTNKFIYRFTKEKVRQVSAGRWHSIAIKTNGDVVAWGAGVTNLGKSPHFGQSIVPKGLKNIVAVAAGDYHSLALKEDGTVVAWGSNSDGQTTIPTGLINVIAIAAGDGTSMALKADGKVVTWGQSQAKVPKLLSGVGAISAGGEQFLALRNAQSVVRWGDQEISLMDKAKGVIAKAADLNKVIAIDAGNTHSLVLKADGSIASWGTNGNSEAFRPKVKKAKAISAGNQFSLAILADGSVTSWGKNNAGQKNVPSTLKSAIAISAGYEHALAISSDGMPFCWGSNAFKQCDIPAKVTDDTPPSSPTNPVADKITASGFTLTWNAAEDPSGIAGYQIYINEDLYDSVETTTAVITGLDPLTVYEVEVAAVDEAENISEPSDMIEVKTIESEPPSIPTGLAANNVTASGFTLTWEAATDNSQEPVSYEVFLDGVSIGKTSTTTFAVTGLTEYVLSAMTVKAIDVHGNVSGPTTILSVRTLDVTAPTAPTGLAASNITGSGFAVTWNLATDSGSGIAGYQVYLNMSLVATVPATTHVFGGLSEMTTYSVTVKAIDVAGNSSVSSNTATATTMDNTPPSTPTNVVVSEVGATSFKVTWGASTDSGSGVSSYQILLNGSVTAVVPTWPHTLTGLAEFTDYSVAVRAIDNVGNLSSSSTTVMAKTTDASAPTIPTNLVASEISATSFKLTWSASTDSGSGVATYLVYLDGVEVASVNLPTYTFSGLAEFTAYEVKVKAKDNTNNESGFSAPLVTKTADVTVPSTPTDLVVSDITVSGFKLTWSAATDSGSGVSSYKVILNGVEIATVNSATYTFTGLAEFTDYTVSLKSVDVAGNQSSLSASQAVQTLDATAPSDVTLLTVIGVTDSDVELSWQAATDSGSGISHYEVYDGQVLVNTTPELTFVVSELTPYTSHNLVVKAVDVAGNKSSGSTVTATTTDSVPPTVPLSLSAAEITATSFLLKWNVSTDVGSGVAKYEVYQDGELIGETVNLEFSVTGLVEITEYAYSVVAYDVVGNKSDNSAELNVKTKDGTAPTAPTDVTAGNIGTGSFKLSWSPSMDNVGVKNYEVYKDGVLIYIVILGQQYLVPGLQPDTSYSFTIRATDEAGNKSEESEALTVSTQAGEILDTVAPTAPTNLNVTVNSAGTITFTWTAATDNVGVTEYEVYLNDDILNYSSTNSFTASGLQLNTNYTFNVRAFDSAGNTSLMSDPLNVTTAGDTVAPTAPLNLNEIEKSTHAVTFGWDAASDDIGVTGYEVYMNGTLVGTTAMLQYQIDGLTAVTTYSFAVKAYDAAGNKSDLSGALSVTTNNNSQPPSPPDDLIAFNITDTAFWLDWTDADDDVQVTGYEVYRNGTLFDTVNGTTTTLLINGLTPSTLYGMYVVALDADGNKSEPSDTLNVTTFEAGYQPGPYLRISKLKGAVTSTSATITYTVCDHPTDNTKDCAKAKVTLRVLTKTNVTKLTVMSAIEKLKGTYKVTVPVSSLADGTYYIQLIAADTVVSAKRSIVLRTLTVDKIRPVISGLAANAIAQPVGSTSSNINYTLSEYAYVTAKLYTSTGALVRTLATKAARQKGANTFVWNGRNNSNLLVPDGTYTLKVDAVDRVALTAIQKTITINVELRTPLISAVSDSPDPLKATGALNSAIKFTLSERAAVTLRVHDSSNTAVRTLLNATLNAGSYTYNWNARNDASTVVADGIYTYKLNATDLAAKPAVERTGTIRTDKTIPVVSGITFGANPFTATGTNVVGASYQLSESAKVYISIYNSANTVVKTIASGDLKASGTNTFTWSAKNNSNQLVSAGTYTVKIYAVDLVGWTSATQSATLQVLK
jgi:chitodextrinase/alpha-tubulin suppressor-like RCC1 family protein/flagellar hook assembly protein FlgD